MPEPTYTITITESQRTLLARALGLFVAKLTDAPIQVDAPANPSAPLSGTEQARAILSPPAVVSSPAPIAARDRWARDRKGNEVPHPEGSETYTVRISKAERKDLENGSPRMKITWANPGARGFTDANCFDEHLFPFLAAAKGSGAPTIIHLVRKDKYLNLVGVCA